MHITRLMCHNCSQLHISQAPVLWIEPSTGCLTTYVKPVVCVCLNSVYLVLYLFESCIVAVQSNTTLGVKFSSCGISFIHCVKHTVLLYCIFIYSSCGMPVHDTTCFDQRSDKA
jgi:hypothetical protein